MVIGFFVFQGIHKSIFKIEGGSVALRMVGSHSVMSVMTEMVVFAAAL